MAKFGFPGFPWAPGVPEARTREDRGILWPPRQGYSKSCPHALQHPPDSGENIPALPRVGWDASKRYLRV